ncbi:MAG: ATP-binding protein [Deltaproteobacteria bacterium]|jgi:AAA+ ATPase superfamily predicted ATPase|nr:ATP-binding protein [Deltaproteobacteria bacterium]
MKFYNRRWELKELRSLYRQCVNQGKMTVLTGRRRVGKTLLATEFAQKQPHIYLFISRKSESLLCDEFLREIRQVFDLPVIGQISTFKEILQLLLELSLNKRFTLIIDEFQEFYTINPSVYSDIQNLWDRYRRKSKLNMIFIGSVYSLMNKIFQDSKEPLFNRADRQFLINPFPIKDIAEILKDFGQNSTKTLFDYYVITGGMPIYIDLLATNKAFKFNDILDFVLHANSPLLYEGKNVLIEEFGKEYNIYFSILSLIASGKTSRPAIESILERNIGGYIERLESDFAIIGKRIPINAKPGTRFVKYRINDNFLSFWFRFIYRNMSAIETGNYEYVKALIVRDYSTYCGPVLEKMFRELLATKKQYNKIGAYWDRKSENEIDIVAVNEMKKKILMAEVKLNLSKISIKKLKEKSEKLLVSYPGHKTEFKGLSMANIVDYLK